MVYTPHVTTASPPPPATTTTEMAKQNASHGVMLCYCTQLGRKNQAAEEASAHAGRAHAQWGYVRGHKSTCKATTRTWVVRMMTRPSRAFCRMFHVERRE